METDNGPAKAIPAQISSPSSSAAVKASPPPQEHEDRRAAYREKQTRKLAMEMLGLLADFNCPSELQNDPIHLSILVTHFNKSQSDLRSAASLLTQTFKLSEDGYRLLRVVPFSTEWKERTIYVENVKDPWDLYVPGVVYISTEGIYAFVTFCDTDAMQVFLETHPWVATSTTKYRSMTKERYDQLEKEYLQIKRGKSEPKVLTMEKPRARLTQRWKDVLSDSVRRHPRGVVVYISNLGDTTKADIKEFCSPVEIEYVDYTKGLEWAHVRCQNAEDATALVESINGKSYGSYEAIIEASVISGQREAIYWDALARKKPDAKVLRGAAGTARTSVTSEEDPAPSSEPTPDAIDFMNDFE